MKPCDRWREELADHILGAPASPALAAHSGTCAACSAARAEWQERMGQIDAGIRQLTASEPTGDVASRVLAEVRLRRRRLWVPEWKTVALALAGLTVLALSLSYVRRTEEPRKEAVRALGAAAAIASWRSPTQSLLRSPTDPWLKSVPRLGGYFYELRIDALKKGKGNP